MPRLTIDGKHIDVPDGSSVLEAARALGIEIPALCHLESFEPETSCMVCLVRDVAENRLIPSCAAPASDGMVIDTRSQTVISARRQALELLLGEHVGDCEAPCRRACPAFPDIPGMIQQIAAGEMARAVQRVKAHNPFPALMGAICSAPCERACRRAEVARVDPNRRHGQGKQAVAIRLLEGYIGRASLKSVGSADEERAASMATQNKVAVVGAGLTGLSAAYFLFRHGHSCTAFEKRDVPGGLVRDSLSSEHLELFDSEIQAIRALGVQIVLKAEIKSRQDLDALIDRHDAVVLASGSAGAADLKISTTERGIRVDPVTLETSRIGVFAGGDAVRSTRLAVRAIAAGRALADAVDRWLDEQRAGARAAEPRPGAARPFDSRIGRIRFQEIEPFSRGASEDARTPVEAGSNRGYTEREARHEALRCLNCDCRKSSSCALRLYADEYGAQPLRGEDRHTLTRVDLPFGVVFEQTKCIRCGRCVKITRELPYGFTFTRRGYDMEVSIPFGRNDLGAPPELEAVLARCVESCPTAALAFENRRIR